MFGHKFWFLSKTKTFLLHWQLGRHSASQFPIHDTFRRSAAAAEKGVLSKMDLSKAVALLRTGDVDAEAIFEVPKKQGVTRRNTPKREDTRESVMEDWFFGTLGTNNSKVKIVEMGWGGANSSDLLYTDFWYFSGTRFKFPEQNHLKGALVLVLIKRAVRKQSTHFWAVENSFPTPWNVNVKNGIHKWLTLPGALTWQAGKLPWSIGDADMIYTSLNCCVSIVTLVFGGAY